MSASDGRRREDAHSSHQTRSARMPSTSFVTTYLESFRSKGTWPGFACAPGHDVLTCECIWCCFGAGRDGARGPARPGGRRADRGRCRLPCGAGEHPRPRVRPGPQEAGGGRHPEDDLHGRGRSGATELTCAHALSTERWFNTDPRVTPPTGTECAWDVPVPAGRPGGRPLRLQRQPRAGPDLGQRPHQARLDLHGDGRQVGRWSCPFHRLAGREGAAR